MTLGRLAAEPHHDGSALYVSTAHPELGQSVQVRLRIPVEYGAVSAVRTRSNPDHEPRFAEARRLGPAAADSPTGVEWWQAEVLVQNPVHGYRFLIERADGRVDWLSNGGLSDIETRDDDDFRLITYPPAPAWGAEAVMYQVFPDRFARSAAADARPLPEWAEPAEWDDEPIFRGPSTPRQFYGGDLDGIVEHLDHLERLGVTLLYLTPVFPGRSNHRYDAHTFDEVDPLLGGDAALARLTAAAHERGIRVMGDLTSNHSGDAHEWFRASHGQPGTPESDFYYWLDDEQRDYESWLGVASLPKLNWNSPELRRRFIEGPESVVARWLRPPYALDGWRIDVANMTGRFGEDDLNEAVRRTIRQTMIDVNPDTLLLAEYTNDAAKDLSGDGWHGAMTYASFTRPVWAWLSEPGPVDWFFGIPYPAMPQYTAEQVYHAHRRFTAAMPWRTRIHTMNALDTHDTARFAGRARPGTVPVAAGLSMTLPGIPVIFAGDELGATGENGEHSRTTMPWHRLDEHAERIELYAQLVRLRREHPALSHGGLRWLHVDAESLVFVRESQQESVLVLAARGDVDVRLAESAISGPAQRLLGSATLEGARIRSTGTAFTAWSLPGVAPPV
ncbi:glycoside hydrolase family 13 protein [Microcella humidisoli]|uniref:Glycoside hydrolase family 13 protein n=1 Tax=Microcella humidisoli TaxID=2963406 RepID=A0ABY5FY21_9MICO|nr:glycoside hydrolase family 13 protein [Microcella humidisoli]UTT63225.1 glycoside hydrolase family 13 protein [Microcella humidisoli]